MEQTLLNRGPGRLLSALVLLAVLGAIAFGIGNRASRAVAPPVYDPVGYFQKGTSVWREIADGNPFGLMNAEPVLRPPGCVPFTQPFGPATDFRSFLFWSAFSPVALWIAALWLGLSPRVETAADRWTALGLCTGLASLPMFYHFEVNAEVDVTWVGQWGLQDPLVAALAALATVLVCRGAARRSAATTTAGWMVAAYLPLVKPVGLILMTAILGVWVVEMIVARDPDRESAEGNTLPAYPVVSLFSAAMVYGVTVVCCLSTGYLSSANISTAVAAQEILRSLHDPSLIRSFVRPVLGWFWFPLLAAASVGALLTAAVRRPRGASLRIAAAFLVLAGGAAWWIFLAGLEARYLYPFLLLPLAWLLPDAFAALRRAGDPLRVGLAALCVVPTVVLAILMGSANPPVALQQALGVNLSSGAYAEETRIAGRLMDEARTRQRPLVVYAHAGYRAGVVHAVDFLHGVSTQRPALLTWVRPLDWVRPPGVRISDLMNADYVLYERRDGTGSFQEELQACDGWLAALTVENGIVREIDGPLTVLRITDPERVLDSFRRFAARRQWSPAFAANNPEIAAPETSP